MKRFAFFIPTLFVVLFLFCAADANAQCEIKLSRYSTTFDNVNTSFDVIAPPDCAWTATSNANWILFSPSRTSSVSGVGNGTIFPIFLGNTGDTREGVITVGNQTHTVRQPSNCNYYIIPEHYFTASGGTREYQIPSNGGNFNNCRITYTTNALWIILGTEFYSVSPNNGGERSGAIVYNYGNNQTTALVVHQAAATTTPTPTPTPTPQNCLFLITPNTQDFPASGGTGTITVTGQTGCSYSSLNESDFVTLDSGASGTGTGTVSFTVAPNSGASRSFTLFVAGQNFTVVQSGIKSRKRVRFF